MEGMFNDMNLNEDLAMKFKQFADNQAAETAPMMTTKAIALPFEFTCKLLTITNWPISACELPLEIPQPFSDCQAIFKRFYDQRHSGRKLSWHYTMVSISYFDYQLHFYFLLYIGLCRYESIL
jgi:cullin 1